MAESLPSPPLSRASTPGQPTLTELKAHLDGLLVRYLELLDQYTILRSELSKTFSNGFFSLANAQRTATLGPGRRYGQDGYDGRMKSLRRVRISINSSQKEDSSNTSSSTGHAHVQAAPTLEIEDYSALIEDDQQSSSNEEAKSLPHTEAVRKKQAKLDNSSKTKLDPAYRDPASWYGILIPQQLRQTQTSFVYSVTRSVPSLANVAISMNLIEQEIRAVRQKLNDHSIDAQGSGSLSNDAEPERTAELLSQTSIAA